MILKMAGSLASEFNRRMILFDLLLRSNVRLALDDALGIGKGF